MPIFCPNCKAQHNMPEDKAPAADVKIKCACGSVFSVKGAEGASQSHDSLLQQTIFHIIRKVAVAFLGLLSLILYIIFLAVSTGGGSVYISITMLFCAIITSLCFFKLKKVKPLVMNDIMEDKISAMNDIVKCKTNESFNTRTNAINEKKSGTWAWSLVIIGIFGLIATLSMDTSVSSGGGDRVHNIGLMHLQQNLLFVFIAIAIVGVVVLVSSNRKTKSQASSIDPDTIDKNQAHRTCPFCAEHIKALAIVCRYCGRDVVPIED